MSVEVKRSPTKLCWWVTVNGIVIDTKDTRREAREYADYIKKKYL